MVTVCLAMYNGEKFIESQLNSILIQMNYTDELIIVDDASTDNSRLIVESINDQRIRLLINMKNIGVSKSFEKALLASNGDYIFFSDQDDLWLPNKIEKVIECFKKSGALAVVTDAKVEDSDGIIIHESYFAWRNSGSGLIKNFYHNSFFGCCMAIRKDSKSFILPFPSFTYLHDQWAGFACTVVGKVYFLPEKLLIYRRHENTVTNMHPSDILTILKIRLRLALCLLFSFLRLLKWRLKFIFKIII